MPVRKGTVRYTMCLTETEREQFPLLAQRGTWPALNQGREKSLSITPVSLACSLFLKKKKNPPKAFILETQNLSPSRLLSPAQYWSCNYCLEGQNGPFNVWSWDVIKSKCWQQVSPTFTKRFHAKMHVRAGLGKHKKKKKQGEKNL